MATILLLLLLKNMNKNQDVLGNKLESLLIYILKVIVLEQSLLLMDYFKDRF